MTFKSKTGQNFAPFYNGWIGQI